MKYCKETITYDKLIKIELFVGNCVPRVLPWETILESIQKVHSPPCYLMIIIVQVVFHVQNSIGQKLHEPHVTCSSVQERKSTTITKQLNFEQSHACAKSICFTQCTLLEFQNMKIT